MIFPNSVPTEDGVYEIRIVDELIHSVTGEPISARVSYVDRAIYLAKSQMIVSYKRWEDGLGLVTIGNRRRGIIDIPRSFKFTFDERCVLTLYHELIHIAHPKWSGGTAHYENLVNAQALRCMGRYDIAGYINSKMHS
jgi:hypothetical protein